MVELRHQPAIQRSCCRQDCREQLNKPWLPAVLSARTNEVDSPLLRGAGRFRTISLFTKLFLICYNTIDMGMLHRKDETRSERKFSSFNRKCASGVLSTAKPVRARW